MKLSFEDIFSFEIFFIILRESLEIIIIVSILLAFLKQSLVLHHSSDSTVTSERPSLTATADYEQEDQVSELLLGSDRTNDLLGSGSINQGTEELTEEGNKLYKQFKLQIISGSVLGLLISLTIGGSFIAVFYSLGTDLWSLSEHYYEGLLSLMASVIISVMGLFFLRLTKLQDKFRVKLATLLNQNSPEEISNSRRSRIAIYLEKYALFVLPLITCLRESLEAFVFIGGIGISQPLSTLPLSSILGVLTSAIAGYYIYKSTNSLSIKIFLISTTSLLYLIAAGLFSKGVWQLELQRYINLCHGQDMSEVGSGPGSYDISNSVWHVNCCNGETDGLWMLFTAILGWTNSATWGSVLSYITFWSCIILTIKSLIFEEKNGYFPLIPINLQKKRLLKKYTYLKKRRALTQNKQKPYIPVRLLE